MSEQQQIQLVRLVWRHYNKVLFEGRLRIPQVFICSNTRLKKIHPHRAMIRKECTYLLAGLYTAGTLDGDKGITKTTLFISKDIAGGPRLMSMVLHELCHAVQLELFEDYSGKHNKLYATIKKTVEKRTGIKIPVR